MAITTEQKAILNKRTCPALAKVQLGDLIEDAEEGGLAAGSVDTTELAADAVTAAKVADDAIGGEHLFEQAKEQWFPAGVDGGNFTLDDTAGAAKAILGTTNQAQIAVINFDAASGDDDDIAYFNFLVPQNYKTDSLRLDLIFTHTDADNSTETVTWIAAANAVEPSAGTLEAFDAAGTAITATLTKELTAASAGKLEKVTLDPEVEDIAAGDLLTVKLVLDASSTGLDASEHVQLLGINARWDAKETA